MVRPLAIPTIARFSSLEHVTPAAVCLLDSDSNALTIIVAIGQFPPTWREAIMVSPKSGSVTDALRDSERRYALAIEATTEGLYEWEIETNALDVSERLNSIIGLAAGELSAEDWSARVHPDDFTAYRAALISHFKGGADKLTCEYRILRKTGDFIWIADHGICIRDDHGKAIRLVGAVRNITARKLAEQRLRTAQEDAEKAQQQLIDALESISEGIVLFDRDDRIIVCNSNYRSYFAEAAGADVAELIVPGALFWDFMRAAQAKRMFPNISDDQFEAYIEQRKSMRRQPRESIEQHIADGRWLQINERKTADGGIASIYTDITEMKQNQEALAEKTEMLETLSGKLSKYLSPQVYASIFSGEQNVEVASKRKKLTIFFSDIVDFTATADSLESEELTSLLNQYLTEMSKIALAHGATIDKFIGDAILAFFGDPHSKGTKEDAAACVRMGIAMQQRMRELQVDWRERGLDRTFELRIGINTGYCTVGNFGSDDRMDYTVVGNEVNLAARLQTRAETGGILMAGETYSLVKDIIHAEEQSTLTLKGIPRPVQSYKVIGIYDDLVEEGQVIRHDQGGLQLTVDLGRLDGDEKKLAISVLEETAAKLRE